MKTIELDTPAATNKWAAAMDRQRRNTNNASLYTLQQRTRAIRMRDAMECVYGGRHFDSPSYGKRGISVKIEDPVVRNRRDLKLLENAYEKEGIIKKKTPQGICYYIPK